MIKNYLRSLSWHSYNIGFIEGSPADFSLDYSQAKVQWLDCNGYSRGWVADPFIYSVSPDQITLLVEEYHSCLGLISRIVVERGSYKIIDMRPVIELDTHLSFPYIVKDTDSTPYICPENIASGSFKIYPYSDNEAKVGDPITIIDKPLVDAQILHLDGKFYVFSIISKLHNKLDSRHLEIFVSDRLTGPYTHFQTIENPNCQERGAGAIFRYNGELIRPTQLSDNSYGEATIFKRLKRAPDGRFEQEYISTFYPQRGSRYPLCLHTFNSMADITVIDGLRYNHPFFAKYIIPFFKSIKS